jgi:hypothetical protein
MFYSLFIALLFAASAIALVGSLVALFFRSWRWRAKRVALASTAALVLSVVLILRVSDEEARAKGFLSSADLQAAKRAGVTDVVAWTAQRQKDEVEKAAAKAVAAKIRSEEMAAAAAAQAAAAKTRTDEIAAAAEAQAAAAKIRSEQIAAAAEAQAALLRPLPQERQFIEAVRNAQLQYKSGSNDLQKGAARPTRARSICSAMPEPRATDWIGTIDDLSTNGDGDGVLSIKIAERAHVKTNTNSFADHRTDTLIKANSSLYRDLLKLKIGETVRFSGSFFAGGTDCFQEQSVTLAGSITEPEFLFRFSRVELVVPLTQSAGR